MANMMNDLLLSQVGVVGISQCFYEYRKCTLFLFWSEETNARMKKGVDKSAVG